MLCFFNIILVLICLLLDNKNNQKNLFNYIVL